MRVSLFTGRVARWSVSVALCRSILRIRLVVCVGRDAKERSRGERVLIDSANRPNEQLVSQDPFKSDGSQGRTSPEGEP